MKKKIAVLGYYGFGNIGDEAVLSGMLHTLSRASKIAGLDLEFTVLSADVRDTVKRHEVLAVNRMNLRGLIDCLRSCDALLIGGGSLFQDVTGRGLSVLYYAGISIMAAFLGKKVIFYAQGIGPIKKRLNRILFQFAVKAASLISVRDTASLFEVKRISKHRNEIKLTSDPAFAVTPNRESPAIREIFSRLPQKPLLGVMLRDWRNLDGRLGDVAKACAILSEKLGINVVLIPMQKSKDLFVCRRLMDLMGGNPLIIEDDLSPEEMVALFERFDLVLAMRLHALIFAAIAGVPMLGIIYDPKINAFLAHMEMQLSTDTSLVSEEDLIEKGFKLWNDSESIRERLLVKSKGFREEAFGFAERVVETLMVER